MEILENRKRISDIKKNRKIEKTNISLENPKAQNKKESKPKSNLNLSNKKHSLKSNISHPNLEKMEKTYRYRFQRSDGGKYIA